MLASRVSRFAVLVGFVATMSAWVLAASRSNAANSSAFKVVTKGTANSPVAVIWDPKSKAPLVVEQGGVIKPLKPTKENPAVALDVTKEVSSGGERGLLGATFSNDGSYLYVDLTNEKGDTEIREYGWAGGFVVDKSVRTLLTIEQPYSNHNGGGLKVDSEGMLWIGMGDGGSAGDPENRAQNPDVLLGKILRINPRPVGSAPYGIPTDNPFASGGGRPEIWAIGLRNPWRFDIDEKGRRLFIGDVGQNKFEEVNAVSLKAAKPNFGWRLREGMHPYEGDAAGIATVAPITEYPHREGCSVTGGVFYTGKALPGLAGRFFYGDYCKGWIASIGQRSPGAPWKTRKLGVTFENLSSFNTAPDGEIWLTSTKGTIALLTGR
jgi:glucose/arabinose dehydrogenase